MTEDEKRAYLKELLLKKKSAESTVEPITRVSSLDKSFDFMDFQKKKKQLSTWGAADIYYNQTEGIAGNTVSIKGREMINFSSYNYVGLSGNPVVSQAAKDAIDGYGTSASASRIASGEKPLHRDLEQAIARFLGTEDAIVMVGGFSTNESTIGHVMGEKDLILYDSYIHESIQRGSKLSGATIKVFPHNRWQALETILARHRDQFEKVLIIIEGVYSMDGDIPELPEFVRIKKEHQSMLMIDEAHSMGVIGKTGRGISEYHQVDPGDVDLWMGTLSKAFASCGGYIATSKAVVEYLKFTIPGFVFSVSIPPADAAAARTAISVLDQQPERAQKVQANGRYFLNAIKAQGWNPGPSKDSAVIPLILGDTASCIQLYHCLFKKGIFVIPIVYPAVPENAARLRFFINSSHTKEQMDKTIKTIAECLK